MRVARFLFVASHVILAGAQNLTQEEEDEDAKAVSEAIDQGSELMIKGVGGMMAANRTLIADKCGPVYEDAKNAAMEKLGMAAGATQNFAREKCFELNEQECGESFMCTYCEGNRTCWPGVDQDNPCQAMAMDALLFGYEAGKAAGALGISAANMTMNFLSECSKITEENECTAGFNSAICTFCNVTQTCHIKGSLADKCTRDALIKMTVDGAKQAAKEAKDYAKAKIQGSLEWYEEYCGNFTDAVNGSSDCTADWNCMFCDTPAEVIVNATTNETKNVTCFSSYDYYNPCMQDRMGPFITAAGHLKSAGDSLSKGWQDTKTWAANLCGRYNNETTPGSGKWTGDKGQCESDRNCYFCDDDSLCYVYGDGRSPCSSWQQGKEKVKDAWNKYWSGDGCSTKQKDAYAVMKELSEKSMNNLASACSEFAESEVYASKTMAGKASAASEMAGAQIAKARRSLQDTVEAINETGSANSSLEAYTEQSEAEGCSVEELESMSHATRRMPEVTMLMLLVVKVVF